LPERTRDKLQFANDKRARTCLTVSTLLFSCLTCFLGIIVILQVFLLFSDLNIGQERSAPTPTALALAQAANPYPTQTPYPTHTPNPPCPVCADCPALPTPKPTSACTPCPPTPTPTATSLATNTPRPQPATPTPTDTPAPTEAPKSQYDFDIKEIDHLPYPHCDKNSFVVFNAYITDANGDPVGGYRLQGVNAGGTTAPPSSPSSREWGYDIGFGESWRHDTNVKYELPGGWTAGGWSIFVIDENGKQISPAFNWTLDPTCHNLAWVWFVPWGTVESQ
jgi:hypothetical protein